MKIQLTKAEVEYLKGLVSQDEEGCLAIDELPEEFDVGEGTEAKRQLKLAASILGKLRTGV